MLSVLWVSQGAKLLALQQAVSPEGGVLLCTLATGAGFFLGALYASSAAPPAAWQALAPKLDPSTVSIFMGVQGWDLAADALKELFYVDGVLRTRLNHDGTDGLSILLSILQGHLPNI